MKQKSVKNNIKNVLAKPKDKKLNKKVEEEPIVESDEEELQEEDIENESENMDEVEDEDEDDKDVGDGSSDEDVGDGSSDEDVGDGSSDEDKAVEDAGNASHDGDKADEEEKLKKTNGVTNGTNLSNKMDKRKALASKTITVASLRKDISLNTISEKFQQFGEIRNIYMKRRGEITSAKIIYVDAEAANEATKLDGTFYYGLTIRVNRHSDARGPDTRNPERTITIFNKQNLTYLTDQQVEALKTAFGPIDKIDILCKNRILAFVTLKKEKQVKKAILLNGTTVGGIELDIEFYKPFEKSKRSILVQNLGNDVSEDDLRAHFKDCGNIEFVKRVYAGNAQIAFDNDDAFCKSFLLEETNINGQTIYITPFSIARQRYLGRTQANKRAARGSFESHKKRFKFNPKYRN